MAVTSQFRLTNLFKDFFRSEKASGLVLMLCTVVSILLANSDVGNAYHHLWSTRLNFSFQNVHLDYSVEEWINDGLMTIFFLMVGLEIERELYIGELSDFKNASLPIVAAIGGMIFPALIHFWFSYGTPTQRGIGIPMATDIAFSIGALSLFGKRVPPALKVFLVALAIIDDLGAVIIIAIFYTNEFSIMNLGIALGIFAFLILLNRLNVYRTWIYVLAGILMWYFMLRSGVHATISGVLLAFTIPFRKDDKINPSYRFQRGLHDPVSFIIMPLFALANTGITLNAEWQHNLRSSNSIGIIAGLVFGKPLGIFIASMLAVQFKLCKLPEHVNRRLLFGAGALAGIGFTMSIFITNLAFGESPALIEDSKIAILAASACSVVVGLIVLISSSGRKFIDQHKSSG